MVLVELMLTVQGPFWYVPDFLLGELTCACNEGQPTSPLEEHPATGQ